MGTHPVFGMRARRVCVYFLPAFTGSAESFETATKAAAVDVLCALSEQLTPRAYTRVDPSLFLSARRLAVVGPVIM